MTLITAEVGCGGVDSLQGCHDEGQVGSCGVDKLRLAGWLIEERQSLLHVHFYTTVATVFIDPLQTGSFNPSSNCRKMPSNFRRTFRIIHSIHHLVTADCLLNTMQDQVENTRFFLKAYYRMIRLYRRGKAILLAAFAFCSL